MNEQMASPPDLSELKSLMAEHPCVLPVGQQTKDGLCRADDATLISMKEISGILEYEPSEFTFTARAGTSVKEIEHVLGERQQYLPFDPLLVGAGATLGGTVASGLSGPGRFRYGGLRDFLLGVRFLSGDGEVIHAGGKVVKNAAGFDLPKFLVGSLGRYGVMLELTFKVFPRSGDVYSLTVQCESTEQALERIAAAASSRWELDAIDYLPGPQSLSLRLAGPKDVNRATARQIETLWGSDVSELDSAAEYWRSVGELRFADRSSPFTVKVPCNAKLLRELVRWNADCEDVNLYVSVAGAVAWLQLQDSARVDQLGELLRNAHAAGLVVQGSYGADRIGYWPEYAIASAVKSALDPRNQFPGF